MSIDLIEGIDPRLEYRVPHAQPDQDPYLIRLVFLAALNSLEQRVALLQMAMSTGTPTAVLPRTEETLP